MAPEELNFTDIFNYFFFFFGTVFEDPKCKPKKTRLQKFVSFFKFRGLRKRNKVAPQPFLQEEPTTSCVECPRISTNIDENVAVVGYDNSEFDGGHQPQKDDDVEDIPPKGKSTI